MKKYVLYVCAMLTIVSCSTIKKTATSADVVTSITQYPVVADCEVKEKITGTVTWSWNPLKRDKFEQKKGNLVAEILKRYDADVLLEPQFIIQKQGYGERSISVSGYPVKYKSFRNATDHDLKAIEAVKVYNKTVKYNEKDGSLKSIFIK